MTTLNPAEVYAKAHNAGIKAGTEAVPPTMIVGQPKGGLFGTEIDYSKPFDVVREGPCGFAWVKIRPARGKFVKWLKEHNIGRRDSYQGGYSIFVGDFGQSLIRKEAYARAFTDVLRENGLEAYSQSRMD
jgi:hypothetical protein